MINKQRSLIAGLQIRYDYRDWWFHLTCINKSRKGKKSYTIEEEACTKFVGPVALTNVLLNLNRIVAILQYTQNFKTACI